MHSFSAFLVALGLAVPGQGPGAPPAPRQDDGPTLTLQQAVDEARLNNPELAAVRAQIGVARERPAQARALAPPMFETTIWQAPLNSLNPANTNMYMFLASQELPGSGKRDVRAAAAARDIAIAENDVRTRERDTLNAVRQTYAQLSLARRSIAIHLDAITLVRQFADLTQARYETARISQQDVLKPVVELSRLHAEIISFDQQARLAAARLNALLGRPVDAAIGPIDQPVERSLTAGVGDLQQIASAREPMVEGTRLAASQAEANLAVARQDYKPDFSVQAGYMLLPHQTDGIMARLAVTWPNAPWSRPRIDARVREAAAAIDAAKARQLAWESSVRLSVQEAYVRVKAAEERASLIRTTIVPQAQQTLEASRLSYQTDRVDLLAMLDNERMLLSAQLDYHRALAEFDQAIADLERAMGAQIEPAQLRPVGTGGR